MKHSKQSLIKLLQDFNQEHGRAPRISETISLSTLPRYKVYEYHFGSWNAAVEAAGLTLAGHKDTNHYLFCICCNAPITIHHNVFVSSKTKQFFCSNSCAAKVNNTQRQLTEETKQKIRTAAQMRHKTVKSFKSVKKRWEETVSGPYTRVFLCSCHYSGKKFYATSIRKVHPTEYESIIHYRYLCRFTFSLSSFPDWFDLSILQKRGMYKASNRGNNLSGVSRDHMFSIAEAYKLKLDPIIIGHPANCQLLIHTTNQHKNTKSCVSIE